MTTTGPEEPAKLTSAALEGRLLERLRQEHERWGPPRGPGGVNLGSLSTEILEDFTRRLREGGLEAIQALVAYPALDSRLAEAVMGYTVRRYLEARGLAPDLRARRAQEPAGEPSRRALVAIARALRKAEDLLRRYQPPGAESEIQQIREMAELYEGWAAATARAQPQLGRGLPVLGFELPHARRPPAPGTALALDLDAILSGGTSPVLGPERRRLIAGVVSAFLEPVTEEQVRHRVLQHRGRRQKRRSRLTR